MAHLPQDDDTPFSLPRDVPGNIPSDYPELDSNVDEQEAYDEGVDDLLDVDPYEVDDSPIESVDDRTQYREGSPEYYTTNHDKIQRWVEHRLGRPAHIVGESDGGLGRGGLYIIFDDDEPDIATEPLAWDRFFRKFERNKLAMIYRTTTRSGDQSRFYAFVDRRDVDRLSQARRVV